MPRHTAWPTLGSMPSPTRSRPVRAVRAWSSLALVTLLAASACGASKGGAPPSSTSGSSGGSSGTASGSPTGSSGSGGASGNSSEAGACPATRYSDNTGACVCADNAFSVDGGACQCVSYLPLLCTYSTSSAQCVDPMLDANNCGACSHVCDPSAACNGGTCGPVPSTLVAGTAGCGALQLAYEGGILYWADPGHGTIDSMPVASDGGAAPATRVTGQVGLASFTVRGGSLYWIDTAGDGGPGTSIVSLPSGAAAPRTLLSMVPMPDGGPNSINAIAASVDGTTIYFAAGTRIYEIPSAGGAAPTLVGLTLGPELGIATALAVDANYIYYVTDSDVEVMSLRSPCVGDFCSACLPDAAATSVCAGKVADGLEATGSGTLIVKGGSIYWDNETSVHEAPTATPIDGGLPATQFPTSMASAVTGFAVGAATVYYGEDGFIEKLPDPPALDEPSIVVARNQPMPSSLTLDGTNLYWTTSRCDIMMLPGSP